MAFVAVAHSQSFTLQVSSDGRTKGVYSLTLFEGNGSRQVKGKPEKDRTVFSGSVKGEVYAELRCSAVSTPLSFFIENSNITIVFDKNEPNRSRINGSRSNSRLRYLLEQCGADDAACLAAYVAENPTSPISTYIMERYLAQALPADTLAVLFATLSGPATQSYHYGILSKRMSRLATLEAGKPLPDFSYTDSDGKKTTLRSTIDSTRVHALLFGATWCSQCNTAAKWLQASDSTLQVTVIDIDRSKQGWDSPFIELLGIDHLPYIILLDPKGRIIARDLRYWEVPRELSHL